MDGYGIHINVKTLYRLRFAGITVLITETEDYLRLMRVELEEKSRKRTWMRAKINLDETKIMSL